MSTRKISLSDEAYERLRTARRGPAESFSDVVMRAVWPDDDLSGGTLLALLRGGGRLYQTDELHALDMIKASDAPPSDKLGKLRKPPSREIMKEALGEFEPGFQITREQPEVQERSDSRD